MNKAPVCVFKSKASNPVPSNIFIPKDFKDRMFLSLSIMYLVYGWDVKLNVFLGLTSKLNLWTPQWELVPVVAMFIIWVKKTDGCLPDAAPKSQFLHSTYKRRTFSASKENDQCRFSLFECSEERVQLYPTTSPFRSCPSFNLQCPWALGMHGRCG